MVDVTAIRAPLFVPATRPDRFAKAAQSGADAVILDLEDAVAPEDKAQARQALAKDFTDLPVAVRINASETPFHADDMNAVAALHPTAVFLPKAEKPELVAKVADGLPGVPVIAIIESALGLANARAIAALDGVVRLAFGSLDYCVDLGCAHLRDILLPARSELVLASKLAGIAPPIDGVTVQMSDLSVSYDDARHARAGQGCVRQPAPLWTGVRPRLSHARPRMGRCDQCSGTAAHTLDAGGHAGGHAGAPGRPR